MRFYLILPSTTVFTAPCPSQPRTFVSFLIATSCPPWGLLCHPFPFLNDITYILRPCRSGRKGCGGDLVAHWSMIALPRKWFLYYAGGVWHPLKAFSPLPLNRLIRGV
eukprot:TRINITY_DN11731_c0_g3_i1.p1 TRINITY_DN11731_c0_g3~~TRINITY_DN11731_c0_g3_i1.p1  ORF type:complete len:108 (+),score=1.34 TRINITY_DN11731_c0_g3_i1:400-723(+)